jgi:6-phosphogluconolactonase
MPEFKRFPDEEYLIQEAVALFIEIAQESIEKRGVFSAALSGGSTPEPLYLALGKPQYSEQLEWDHIHLFFGDERPVPPGHPDSNFRMVKESLLDQIKIPDSNVHRVPAETDVRVAAFAYEENLRSFFKGEWPRFDLVLLGMGTDGHTASLFPHTAGLNEAHRWFIANHVPEKETWRLTLTKTAINNACNIIVLVSGEDKARMLAHVIEGPRRPAEMPIQLIEPVQGDLIWLVDQDAAKFLPQEDSEPG